MVDGDGIHGPHCTLGAKIAAAACRHSRPKGQQVKLSRVPLGAPFSVCKSCRQHARWHPSSRQMLHTKAPSSLCVGFSRQSVGGDTASTNVGGCGAVCECVVKTRDGDRGQGAGWRASTRIARKRGTHWTGEAAGGWRGIGAMDDIPRMARAQPITAPLLALNHMCHPATTTITSQPRLAEGRRPPAPAAGRGGQRRFCSAALGKGCSLWRSLPWGRLCIPAACLGRAHQVTLISHQATNTRCPRTSQRPPPQPSSPEAGHSHAVPPLRLNSRYIPSTCLDSPPCRTPPVDRLRVPLCISITVCFGRADTMILSIK